MPDARVPEGSITLNGETFVPLAAWEAERDAKGRHVRTLAVAHMHLVLDGEHGRDNATHVIQRDTGYGVEDARAVASVVAWARSSKSSSSEPPHADGCPDVTGCIEKPAGRRHCTCDHAAPSCEVPTSEVES